MSDQYGVIEFEGLDDGEHIVTETVGGVITNDWIGLAGVSEASARDAVDVIVRNELWSEFVVDMGVVAETSEKDQRPTDSTPVQDFELDVLIDGDELNNVRGGVGLVLCV